MSDPTNETAEKKALITQRPGDALRAAGIKPLNPFEFIWRYHPKVRITPTIADEMAQQTGYTARFWLNLQEAFDGRTSDTTPSTHLVVVRPFDGLSRGDVVIDPARVTDILRSERAYSVVRVAANPTELAEDLSHMLSISIADNAELKAEIGRLRTALAQRDAALDTIREITAATHASQERAWTALSQIDQVAWRGKG